MPRAEKKRVRSEPAPPGQAEGAPPRPCCMVSELLEESGLDRDTVRQLRRQVLEGLVLLCQWQLERMHATEAAPPPARPPRRARRVEVE